MSYQIRFRSKRDHENVGHAILGHIEGFFRAISSLVTQNPPAAENAVLTITARGREIVECSNLRTICAPSENLKATQRALLRELDRIPMHRAAHGFIKNRNPHSCAMAHMAYWGKTEKGLVILNMDAKNFFHSITGPDVRRALAGHGIVGKNVTGIMSMCMAKPDLEMALAIINGLKEAYHKNPFWNTAAGTNKAKMSEDYVVHVIDYIRCRALQSDVKSAKKVIFAICKAFLSLGNGITATGKFLPQGSPTSPFLSNLVMKLADIRITALAKSMGGFYTRYADDLTISFPVPTKGAMIDGTYRAVVNTLRDYHIELNPRKKKVMGTSMSQDIVGYRVNSGRPTISRKIRRNMKAAIHNEIVRGSRRFHEKKRAILPGEDYRGVQTNPKKIQMLEGLNSHCATAHPAEAARNHSRLHFLRTRSPRELDQDVPSLSIIQPGGADVTIKPQDRDFDI